MSQLKSPYCTLRGPSLYDSHDSNDNHLDRLTDRISNQDNIVISIVPVTDCVVPQSMTVTIATIITLTD
ncbi:hypothetical protein J6590_023711 [Homalodisca vitripennis]|nr:hypothetical protein J6590_023711 [Homalodisca vitripennis]